MKTLLVYAHPNQNSFNWALKEVALAILKDLKVSDLYAMDFKAAADWRDFTSGEDLSTQYGIAQQEASQRSLFTNDIRQEQEKLIWCEQLILQFPLWFFSVPAILKGWIDRVLSYGFAYEKGKWFEEGLLKGRRAMLALTTQSSEEAYSPKGIHGDLKGFLSPVHHTLRLAGFTLEEPFIAYGVHDSPEVRRSYSSAYQQRLSDLIKKKSATQK